MFKIPNLGSFKENSGLIHLKKSSDGFHCINKNGVVDIIATGDHKVEFICYKDETLAYVLSSIGYPAYYKVLPTKIKRPIKAVLMDLDGTSVKSEGFWIWIIEKTTQSLLKNPDFRLSESDLPYVSGHSVSEHLKYCIDKYCPNAKLAKAREIYFKHTHHEMNEIMNGRGKKGAFAPSDGLKQFLLALKKHHIKIGLVTSGLYEKAWPEVLSAFKTIKLGNPKEFYDAIISAGYPLRKGEIGTLGELSPKPHPWLYAETGCVGLNIPFKDRNSVVGIEDSAAGVCSIRLAGYPTIGIAGGNIVSGGCKPLCEYYAKDFKEILDYIFKK